MKKMFGHRLKKSSHNKGYDEMAHEKGVGEPSQHYEGKEHVKYRDPGHSPHDIDEPEDEPHMKSHANKQEEHEAEDDYHMGVPDQTKGLAHLIKRARMKMDAPNQQEPKPLLGQLTTNIPLRGVEDTSGEEMEGPHDMQEDEDDSKMPKHHRKKMIVAVMQKKMKKGY